MNYGQFNYKYKTIIILFAVKMKPIYGLIFILLFLTLRTTTATTRHYVQQFLVRQNAARSALKLPPLIWDSKIARYASWYANTRRADCALQHSNGPYGENIFWGSGNGWTPAEAVATWVGERRKYNYWSNSCAYGRECGHYTQVVWRGTKRIGCSRVVCAQGRGVFMICNYDPPGNYVGERPY